MPLTFSPDIRQSPARNKMTSKMTPASVRLMLPSTRSSPRKRLRLQDSPPQRQSPLPVISSLYSPSPDKRRSPVSKRLRLSPTSQASDVSPEIAIKALSHNQLTNLLSSLLTRYPEIQEGLVLPTPDLTHHEENLNALVKNIYKAMPVSRLTETKSDSVAYNRYNRIKLKKLSN